MKLGHHKVGFYSCADFSTGDQCTCYCRDLPASLAFTSPCDPHLPAELQDNCWHRLLSQVPHSPEKWIELLLVWYFLKVFSLQYSFPNGIVFKKSWLQFRQFFSKRQSHLDKASFHTEDGDPECVRCHLQVFSQASKITVFLYEFRFSRVNDFNFWRPERQTDSQKSSVAKWLQTLTRNSDSQLLVWKQDHRVTQLQDSDNSTRLTQLSGCRDSESQPSAGSSFPTQALGHGWFQILLVESLDSLARWQWYPHSPLATSHHVPVPVLYWLGTYPAPDWLTQSFEFITIIQESICKPSRIPKLWGG